MNAIKKLATTMVAAVLSLGCSGNAEMGVEEAPERLAGPSFVGTVEFSYTDSNDRFTSVTDIEGNEHSSLDFAGDDPIRDPNIGSTEHKLTFPQYWGGELFDQENHCSIDQNASGKQCAYPDGLDDVTYAYAPSTRNDWRAAFDYAIDYYTQHAGVTFREVSWPSCTSDACVVTWGPDILFYELEPPEKFPLPTQTVASYSGLWSWQSDPEPVKAVFGGHIVGYGRRFDGGKLMINWGFPQNMAVGINDYKRGLMCHEVGHAVGLQHSDIAGSCMTSSSTWKTPSAAERSRLQMVNSNNNGLFMLPPAFGDPGH